MKSIEIPNSVTEIKSGAFYKCTSLESIVIPFVGNGSDKTYLGYIFGASSNNYNASYVPTSLKTIKVTGGTTIGAGAFYDCKSIVNIELSSTVTSIGESAFSGCSSLTNINIPNGVTRLGIRAFNNCTSLESIKIPNNVSNIGEYAFYGCIKLTIYCEPESKPNGWDSKWNFGNRPVVWGYKGQEE